MDVVTLQAAKAAAATKRLEKQQMLQVVASRGSKYNGTSNTTGITPTHTSATYRTKHIAYVDITSMVLQFGNFYEGASAVHTDGSNQITVSCSVEATDGSLQRVWFRGLRSVTIDPGGLVSSEPLPIYIPRGTVFAIRTYVSVAASGLWPVGVQTNTQLNNSTCGWDTVGDGTTGQNGEGRTNDTDLTTPGSAAVGTAFDQSYSPWEILGTSADGAHKTVLCMGDSIDTYANDFSFLGYNERALMGWGTSQNSTGISTTKIAHINLPRAGETLSEWVLPAWQDIRAGYLRYGTHALIGYGRNDLSGLQPLATIKANLITAWAVLNNLGVKAFHHTIAPHTSSTDRWRTLANQTIIGASTGDNDSRLLLNNWLRDGAPMHLSGSTWTADPIGTSGANIARCAYYGTNGALVTAATGPTHLISGVFELADLCESARDSGLWRVDFVRSVTINTDMTNGVTKAEPVVNEGVTTADIGRYLDCDTAGSAGGAVRGKICKLISSTKVHLDAATATAVTGATAYIGAPSTDGTHPGPDLHRLIAGAIPLAQIT